MKTFQLTIITPEKVFLEGAVVSLSVPNGVGMAASGFGVLADHAPLISTLNPGVMTLTDPETTVRYQIGSGFIDVLNNQVKLLVSSIEKVD